MRLVKLLLGLLCVSLFLFIDGQSANADSYRAVINGQDYSLQVANTKTGRAFAKKLPLSMRMKELNGNEKFYYLSSKLPSNDHSVHQIHKGDVMLYQSRCVVIFYKSFKTNYSYTKIGHLHGLNHLNKSAARVKITH